MGVCLLEVPTVQDGVVNVFWVQRNLTLEIFSVFWKGTSDLGGTLDILDWKEDNRNQDQLKELAPEIQELQENITFI